MDSKVLFGMFLLLFGCASPGPVQCYPSCHVSLDSAEPALCMAASGPVACTAEYRAGDACLKYVKCDSSCRMTENPEFERCISCFRECTGGFEDCESRCG